jgi:hypothetical protein
MVPDVKCQGEASADSMRGREKRRAWGKAYRNGEWNPGGVFPAPASRQQGTVDLLQTECKQQRSVPCTQAHPTCRSTSEMNEARVQRERSLHLHQGKSVSYPGRSIIRQPLQAHSVKSQPTYTPVSARCSHTMRAAKGHKRATLTSRRDSPPGLGGGRKCVGKQAVISRLLWNMSINQGVINNA